MARDILPPGEKNKKKRKKLNYSWILLVRILKKKINNIT